MEKIKKILYDHPVFLFLAFAVVAYLPVVLPYFHLKNDLITQNLPTRFFISESLYSGYFPWWNPYIHFGIPQYGDMNNGFWNPFLWLTAKTFGYNIWTISIEELFYIFIGGWGFYKLLTELRISKGVAILTALSYMSCGYIVGHLQHFCWIAGTGFFPFVCLYFVRINKNPILKNFIIGSLAVFLFASSTHPGLIIGAAYFFAFALAFMFFFRKRFPDYYQPKFWLINFTFILLSCIFSIVIITSNLNVLEHISRGAPVSLSQSLLYPASFQSYLSLLFPLAVNKSTFFHTDISMRNLYMGLAALAGLVFLFRYGNKKVLIFLSLPLLFFALLASGGIYKTFFYHTLPFLDYVRLNGEFAYFIIFIILLGTAIGLNIFIQKTGDSAILRRFLRFILVLCIAVIAGSLIAIMTQQSSAFFKKIEHVDFRSSIKNILDALQFGDVLLLNACIQLITVILLLRRYSHQKAIIIIACNLIITTWLVLPFTGLGMASKRELNAKMSSLPRGIYAQDLVPLNETKFLDSSLRAELWLLGTYSKKIGDPVEEPYPIQLTTTANFFQDTVLHQFINRQAFVFLARDSTVNTETNFDSSNIHIREFGPGLLDLNIHNPGYSFLIFLQNDYPFWETFVDGKKQTHYKMYRSFIGLPLNGGDHSVIFKFNPAPIKKAMKINIAIILAALIILWMPATANRRIFN